MSPIDDLRDTAVRSTHTHLIDPIMFVSDCPHCGKKYQLDDDRAGSTVTCKCGKSFSVAIAEGNLVSANEQLCHNCSEPVLPNWKACPACGAKFLTATSAASHTSPSASPKAADIQAGDNSVVNARINRSTTVTTTERNALKHQSASNTPMISVGSESVVKAEIDASTKIHNDHSRTIHGQYVESQTLVHVGPIVQKMTVSFSSEVASDIERSLPDDPSSLISILAQTNRFLIRNDTLRAKQHVSGGLWKSLSADLEKHAKHQANPLNLLGKFLNGSLTDYEKSEQLIATRHALCLTIANKLHEIAATTGDNSLTRDIEAIDECVLSVKRIHDSIQWLDRVKVEKVWIGDIAMCVFVIGIPLVLKKISKIRSLHATLIDDLTSVDDRLSQLVMRHQYKIPIINLLCAVATADGQLSSDEARSVRSAIGKLDYSASDSILRDCLNAWKNYARQNTLSDNIDAVLKNIEPLVRTTEGKRVYEAAVSVANSDNQIGHQEESLLRTLKEILDVDSVPEIACPEQPAPKSVKTSLLTSLTEASGAAAKLISSKTERAKLTTLTLPAAYRALGKDCVQQKRLVDGVPVELIEELGSVLGELKSLAVDAKSQESVLSTAAKAKSAGKQASNLVRQKQIGMRRDALLVKIGKAIHDRNGDVSGSTELVSPIRDALTRLAVLDSDIARLSEVGKGSLLTPKRLLIAVVIFTLIAVISMTPVGRALFSTSPTQDFSGLRGVLNGKWQRKQNYKDSLILEFTAKSIEKQTKWDNQVGQYEVDEGWLRIKDRYSREDVYGLEFLSDSEIALRPENVTSGIQFNDLEGQWRRISMPSSSDPR